MGKKVIDLTGNKYGKLTVLEYINHSKWKCKCECGNEIIVNGGNLRRLHTKSCGCLRGNDKKAIGATYKEAVIIDKQGKFFTLKCKCGNIFQNHRSNLYAANVLTCPKCSKERAAEITKRKAESGENISVAKPISIKFKIAEIRKEKGITQKELASAVGTVRSRISDMERGTIKGENITLGNAVKIANYLGASIENLFEIEGE